jgi:methyl-accepting chemotaxis protein
MGFVSLNEKETSGMPSENIQEVSNNENYEKIKIIENDLETLSEKLHAKTTEGLAAIEELKGTMEQIAAAAEESAGASEETLSAITEIKQNSKYLEAEVQTTVEVILNFRELLNNSIDSFIEASESLKNTSAKADEISNKAHNLLEASKQINDAVDLITKLSKKTGLLALNAAIEAARAGQSGRSFTVMASEIRSMAKKSNVYAEKISSLVADIQEKIQNANNDMGAIKDDIEKFSEESLRLANEMRQIGEIIENIVKCSDEMLQNIKLTVAEIDDLHQASETIAAAAEESASAVSEVTNTIASQVSAFSESQKAAEILKEILKKENFENELATASEELSYSVAQLEESMKEVVEALTQIEEAAEISKNDAKKAEDIANNCVKYIGNSKNLMDKIYENFNVIKEKFNEISSTLLKMKDEAGENIDSAGAQKCKINDIKSKIRKLNNAIRKIELSIVQIGALSINGAVEAVRIGEGGEGFSEVSHDIRNLADTSEENLDKVINIIDEVNEENDKILVEINNIVLILENESNKLKETTNEFDNSLKMLDSVMEKTQKLKHSIEEMNIALEQIRLASKQTVEAAEIAKNNASESKEAANIILDISKEMSVIINKLKEMSLNLVKSEL